jgi:hypothetical protein
LLYLQALFLISFGCSLSLYPQPLLVPSF